MIEDEKDMAHVQSTNHRTLAKETTTTTAPKSDIFENLTTMFKGKTMNLFSGKRKDEANVPAQANKHKKQTRFVCLKKIHRNKQTFVYIYTYIYIYICVWCFHIASLDTMSAGAISKDILMTDVLVTDLTVLFGHLFILTNLPFFSVCFVFNLKMCHCLDDNKKKKKIVTIFANPEIV
ncbi:hypothetical protein RFI_02976 [Reticulomyxa filosa]|uniref:Uncharacterized protein n=1 Tax=Reticulomyxa filosa TaxID=46433 RepID=X6P7M4_RETFI|nr:hypothetical protein RFI_02976 [Reticulomyxa filosa]|eukprot:ETO34118.1 hypothetical protein RFI_02976 [Reticulomyxa filosa]